jgi:hypothetical protein
MIVIAPAAALLLGACAAGGGNTLSYGEEYDQLVARCQAEGGMVVPLGSGATGRAATDYACQQRHGATRLE